MSDTVTAEALRMACAELASRRAYEADDFIAHASEADVDDVAAEFIQKASGFAAEGDTTT